MNQSLRLKKLVTNCNIDFPEYIEKNTDKSVKLKIFILVTTQFFTDIE